MTDSRVDGPKGYGPTVNIEAESIALAKFFLARHNYVVAHLNENDKTPNIDGRVELKDKHGVPIGSLEVQVKTLSAEHKYKYSCEKGFLCYCDDIAQNPVLFFGVDREEEKVYWLLVDSNLLASLDYKENKGHKTITLNAEQFFDKKKKDYRDAWLEIVQRHKLKVKTFDELEKEVKKLKQENIEVKQENQMLVTMKPFSKEVDINFVNIHRFLDTLNGYLDNEFNIVKKAIYKNCWKLGFAYTDYTPQHATYYIYPIEKNANDVQIKKLDRVQGDILFGRGITMMGCGFPNAIDVKPEVHAKSLLKRDVDKIFRFGLLNYRNDFLANEFIIAAIDKFRIPLGLGKKDSYTLEEIKFGFYKHLLVWIDETIRFISNSNDKRIIEIMNRLINQNGYIDPCILDGLLISEQKSVIAEKVTKQLQENKEVNYKLWNLLWNQEYSFVVFADLLNYLSDKKVKTINRVYKEYKKKEKSFKITEKCLEILRNEQITDDVLDSLKNLKEQEFIGSQNFLDKIKVLMEEETFVKYKHLILEHCCISENLSGYYGFEEFEYNIKKYYENLESAYNAVVKQNFPILEKQLSLYSEFADVDRFVVSMRYEKYDDGMLTVLHGETNPHITICLLSSFLKNDDGKRWSFFDSSSEESEIFGELMEKRNNSIEFEGKEYNFLGGSRKVAHVNEIEKKAIFDYVNKTLKEKVEEILKDS